MGVKEKEKGEKMEAGRKDEGKGERKKREKWESRGDRGRSAWEDGKYYKNSLYICVKFSKNKIKYIKKKNTLHIET